MRRELARLAVMGVFLGVEVLRAVDRWMARPRWTKVDEEAFRLWTESSA